MVRAQRKAWRASSAQCRVSESTRSPSPAWRTIRPSSSAPSSSLWRYQCSFQAKLRRLFMSDLRRRDQGHALAGQAGDLLVHRDDGGEVVLLGHGNLIDRIEPDVTKMPRGVENLF